MATASNELSGTGTLSKKVHQSSSSGSGGGTGGTLSRKPPTYDYFEEPTIYAQIDPYKTTQQTTSSTSTTSPYAQCISSPSASHGTPSTVSPGAVAAMYMPQHPGGYHTLPHQQQHQQIPQQHYHHQYGTISSSSSSHYQQGSGSGHYHHTGGTTMPPPPPPHPSKQIPIIPTTGIVAATTLTSPSSSIPGLGAIGKSYSREIVTVRTPLMYSQQESCV